MPRPADLGGAPKPTSIDQPGTSAATAMPSPAKSLQKHVPSTVRYLRSRRLADSNESLRQTPYVTNWTIVAKKKTPFNLFSSRYPTKASLKGYVFHGEPEIQRIEAALSKLGQYPTDLDDSDPEEVAERHKCVEEDLRLADQVFARHAARNGRAAALGRAADRVAWRQLPLSAKMALLRQDVRQAFETKSVKRKELQKQVAPHTLDWMDDFDMTRPPGRPLFEDIEDPHHYDVGEPPITCCIFTKHANGQISRCLREPAKGFNARLCQKSIRKALPYFWTKTVMSPAICHFHFNVIENEKKNTDENPLLQRPLGRYEEIKAIQFETDAQFEEIAEYINDRLEKTREEQQEVMSFNTRFWKLMDPPKSREPMRKLRAFQRPDRDYTGKSVEQINQIVEEADRRRVKRILRAQRVSQKARLDVNGFEVEDGKRKKTSRKKASPDEEDNLSFSSDNDDEPYLTDVELPDKLSGWLSPPPRCRLGPPSPHLNRLCMDEDAPDHEKKLATVYQALKHGFLKAKPAEPRPEPSSKDKKKGAGALLSPPPPRPSTSKHFDEEAAIAQLPTPIRRPPRSRPRADLDSSSEEEAEDVEETRLLRLFGLQHDQPEPKLTFDGCSGATIRRIKKHYNLPNRSGATSKALLLEGLHEFFTEHPVDYLRTTLDFIAHLKDPKLPLGQTPALFAHQPSPNHSTTPTASTTVTTTTTTTTTTLTNSNNLHQNHNRSEIASPNSAKKRKLQPPKVVVVPKKKVVRKDNPLDLAAPIQPDPHADQLTEQEQKIREQLHIQIKLQKQRMDQQHQQPPNTHPVKEILLTSSETLADDLDDERKHGHEEEEVIEEGVVYPPTGDDDFDGEPVNTSLNVPPIRSPNPPPPPPAYNNTAPLVPRPIRNGTTTHNNNNSTPGAVPTTTSALLSGGIGIHQPNHVLRQRYSPLLTNHQHNHHHQQQQQHVPAPVLPRPSSAHPTYYQPKTFNSIPPAVLNPNGPPTAPMQANSAKPNNPDPDRKATQLSRTVLSATHKT